MPTLAEGALAALDRGDHATHDRLVAEAARDLRDCDVIALAQFSMAAAASKVADATGLPVLTTPDSAVLKLKDFFARFEDVRPAAELMRRAQKDTAKKVRDTAEEAERALGIDLASIPLPPMEGEPGAEAQEPSWGMPLDEEEGGAEPVEV